MLLETGAGRFQTAQVVLLEVLVEIGGGTCEELDVVHGSQSILDEDVVLLVITGGGIMCTLDVAMP